MLIKHYVSLLALSSLSLLSHAQSFNKAKLDSLLTTLASHDKAMGSLTISQNGAVVYSRAIGYESLNGTTKTPATPSTHYRIGSVTKVFTATLIFQLIDEGKLTLDTPLATYFPQLPNAQRITIGQLLSHHSGLHSFTNDATYSTYFTQPKTQAEMLAMIGQGKPDFEPGAKFSYSNAGYVVLGYVVEKITKQPYAQALQKRITNKIGLKDTYYGGKTDPKRHESYSYRLASSWQAMPETDMSIPGGAGAIVSTTTDLNRFAEALFAGKLVSEKSLARMQTITDNGFGMGLMRMQFGAKRAYGHGGSIDGFGTSLGYFPEEKLAVAYISNGQSYPLNDVMLGVLSIYFQQPYRLPDFDAKAPTLAATDLVPYVGTYASTSIPLKITVSAVGATLQAQATGQPVLPLTPVTKDVFSYDAAGIRLEFAPSRHEMLLKQGGGSFLFTLE